MKPDLIKTLAQVQENVPVAMTSDFDVVSSFLRAAETKYVRNLIGAEQFTELKTYFDTESPDLESPEMVMAIQFCQKITSNLGYYLAVPVLSVSVSSSGVQIFSTTDTKSAFQWQVEDLKDALQELGFAAIEELLEYLESQPEKFASYMDSDQYKEQQTFLIRSAADFSRYYEIEGSRYVFQSILGLMRRVEQQTMEKQFGTDFYNGLKAEEQTGKKLILVQNYIKPAVALFTAAKAFTERVITLQNGKVAFNFRGNYNNMRESQAASRDQIKATVDQLETDANMFMQDGLQYIADNSSSFDDFTAPAIKRRFKWNNDPAKGIFGV